MNTKPSRRGFLKSAAVAAGAIGVSRMPGINLLGRAEAAVGAEAPAVFIFNMVGGYNALFGSASSFVGGGTFGCTSTNVQAVGNGLVVDKRTYGTYFSTNTLNHMASIGVKHGLTSHPTAQAANVMNGSKSRLIQLSNSLPGTAAVRCVVMGGLMPAGTHTAINGNSLQQVRDLGTTIAALGGATGANAPDRAIAANGIQASETMSKPKLDANPMSGATLADGYPASYAQLRQPTVAFDYASLTSAYGVTAGATNVNSTTMQIMGAELMIRAGANVVIAEQRGWDTHGDDNGNEVRNKIIGDGTMDALKVFTNRMMAETNRNVVTVVLGDFSRSLPGSNHQPNMTATVIGKYVKLGTTGKVDADVQLPSGTPSHDGLWAYLNAVAGGTQLPFGANPHNLVL